ncbi:phage tail tape measure C-terminal domain-containing protein [uncultured Psychrobacter sp.]|uniref:phage tail tape measure C-terminal domain-containing protein n=1 Tax=uncultured Psychrobacter sp. TaxID=259303 RepID=UPI002614D999|nr:phage tail tape measure C-terminal domain-containing protein [uncultured Psychrobacter sp.]
MSQELRFGLVISADGTAAIRTLDDLDRGLDNVDDASRRADRSTSGTFGRLRERAKGLGGALASAAKKVTMFGGAFAGVVGLIAGSQLSLAREIEQLSRVANVSTQKFQEMAAGAKQYGVEQDMLADILKDTNDKVGDFMQTGGGAMADFFENVGPKVGVTAEMFKDLSGADALQLYYSSLEKANLSQAEMVFYLEAMASDATLLQPLLANNGAEFDRIGKAARDAGMIMSEMDLKNAAKIRGTLGQMGQMFDGFKVAAFKAMMPTLLSIADAFENNQEQIMGWIGGFADGLSSVVGNVATSWQTLKDGMQSVKDFATNMSEALNTPENAERLQTALQAVGDGFSRLKDFALQSGDAIGQVTDFFEANQEIIIPLASGIGAAAGAFLLFNGAVAAWTAIGTLATAVTTGFGAAVALVTSPVFLTVAAIGALVAVGVLLYRNWDTIKAKAIEVFGSLPVPVQEAFGNIKEIFSTVKDWAGAAFDFLAPNVKVTMDLVSAVFTAGWATIKGIFTTSFDVIKGVVSSGFEVIKAVFSTSITVIATVFNTGFELVKNTIKTAFNAIKALARGDIAGFVTIIGSGLKNAVSIVTGGVANIAKAFGGLASKLYNIGIDAVQGLINGVKAKISGAITVAKDLASSVSDTVKNFFIIRSPSRLFKQYGEWLSEGLALGIKGKESEAVQAALSLAQNISNTMNSLKKEIALFGNDSLVASFDYDRANGVYAGIKDSVLDEWRELLVIKENLIAQDKESQKWLTARTQMLDKVAQAQTNETNSLARFASDNQSRLADYAFETSLIGKKASEIDRLRFERDLLNQAERLGITLSEQTKQKIIAEREELIALREQQQALQDNDWVGGIQSGFQSLVDGAQSLNETMTQATTGAFNKMGDSLAAFVTTGKGNFKDLAGSILQDISKMLTQFAMLRLAKAAVGMFADGGAFGSSGLLALAKGGAFNTHSIQYYANGDIFNKPTAFRHAGGLGVMGEAGPEAVMPLTRGPNGKLGVQVFGNQQTSTAAGVVNQVQIDVHITNEGASADVQASTQDGKQLGNSLKAMVLQTLQNEMRPGGMLAAR